MIHYSISPAFLGTHWSSLFLHSSARWRCYGFVSWRRTALENTAADHRFYFTFSYSLLQRDAVHKRGLCRSAVAGWLTGCPSRLCIVSKRVIKFSNFFSPSGFTSFSVPNTMAIFGWDPLWCRLGMKKIEIFDQYLASFRKWYKIGP